jgi:uncharacterized membrane protein
MLLTITLLGILSLTLFGAGDYLIGRGARSVNPHIVNFVLQLAAFIVITPVALYMGISMYGWGDAAGTLLIGLVFGMGYYFGIKALALGPMGVASPIQNAYSVVALVAGLLFFDIALSTTAVFALGMVAVGAVLLTFSKDILRGKLLHSKTARLAGICMITQGMAFAFLTPFMRRNEWHEILFVMSLGTLLVTTAVMFATCPPRSGELKVLRTRQIIVPVVGGLFTGLGGLALFVAGGLGQNIVLPAVLSSASPLATSLIAYVVDRETLPLVNRIGAVMVVAGMAVLNL